MLFDKCRTVNCIFNQKLRNIFLHFAIRPQLRETDVFFPFKIKTLKQLKKEKQTEIRD